MSKEKEKLPDSLAAAKKVDSDERGKKGACPEDPTRKVEAQPVEDSLAATKKVDSDERQDQGSYSADQAETEPLRGDKSVAAKKVDIDERVDEETISGTCNPYGRKSQRKKRMRGEDSFVTCQLEKTTEKDKAQPFADDQIEIRLAMENSHADIERLREDMQDTQQSVTRLRHEVERSNRELRDEMGRNNRELRNEMGRNNRELRDEMGRNNHELAASVREIREMLQQMQQPQGMIAE